MTLLLPDHAMTELAPLVEALAERGYRPSQCVSSESFGNFRLVFSSPGKTEITVVRDRGEYTVEGSKQRLESAGLWKTFPTPLALKEPLLAFFFPNC